MAEVIWTKFAQKKRKKLYADGVRDFGLTTAMRTASAVETIEKILAKYPETGFLEPLLQGLTPIYRARHINKRFKLIYWYDEMNDAIVIADIWDTRRNPQSLATRMKLK